MKVFLLFFTIFFSVSVLADCCNFEIEPSAGQCSTIDHDQNDNCGKESQHSEAKHCHCSPINHFKIIPEATVVIAAPTSIEAVLVPITHSLLISKIESLIFHPPIA